MSRSSTSSFSRPGTGVDDLILVPEDLATPSKRGFAIAIIVLFSTWLIATAVIDFFWPAPVPQPLGIEKTRDDQRRADANWLDGSAARVFESDVELRSRVRHTVRPKYVRALVEYLSEADGDIVIGRDLWLFTRQRLSPMQPYDLELITHDRASQVAAISRAMALCGLRYVSMPVPRKETLYADMLPNRTERLPEFDRGVLAALRDRGVETIDLLPVLAAHTDEFVYFRTGTHWSSQAQLLVAEEVARQTGLLRPETVRRTKLVTRDHASDSDLLVLLGLNVDDAQELAARDTQVLYEVVQQDGSPVQVIQPKKPGRFAIVGTSFTYPRGLPLFLQHYLGAPVWYAAQAATDGIAPLARFLREQPDLRALRVVFSEIPMHMFFLPTKFEGFGSVLASLQPRRPLLALDDIVMNLRAPFAGGPADVGTQPIAVADLQDGRLSHSGQGVVLLRIRGSTSRACELIVAGGRSSYDAAWQPDQREIVLPVVTTFANEETIFVYARSRETPARIEIQSIEVCTPHSKKLDVAWTTKSAESAGTTWRQELEPTTQSVVRRHSAIDLRVSAGRRALPRLRVRLHLAEGRVPLEFEGGPWRSDAHFVHDVGVLAGLTVTSIEIEALGPITGEVTTSCTLRAIAGRAPKSK